MDSGYEAIIVDDSIATTNGINGKHEEEVLEMKTRSKVGAGVVADDDDSSKPKVRLTRATVAHNDTKTGSDTEKKDGKRTEASVGAGTATAAKAGTKEAAAANGGSASVGAPGDNSAAGGGVGATGGGVAPGSGVGANAAAQSRKTRSNDDEAKSAPAPTPKKKASERDDDSGINSRASSVSNDDVLTPARMRTRSSRASSTPAYKRGGASAAARLPLSIYEFDAASFDDDDLLQAGAGATTSKGAGDAVGASLKRKVCYVEEMDDAEAADDDDDASTSKEDGVEPPPKRRAFLASAGAGIVSSLLFPLRALRSGFTALRPAIKSAAPSADEAPAAATTGAENRPKTNNVADADDDATQQADSTKTSSQTVAESGDQTQPQEQQNQLEESAAKSCSLM